jgi:hypothetical protein
VLTSRVCSVRARRRATDQTKSTHHGSHRRDRHDDGRPSYDRERSNERDARREGLKAAETKALAATKSTLKRLERHTLMDACSSLSGVGRVSHMSDHDCFRPTLCCVCARALRTDFEHELRSDPKGVGYAYGGVSPGTLHARGQLVRVHTAQYSIGLAGKYRLHVGLRQQSMALLGSPFDLEVRLQRFPRTPAVPSLRME